MQRLFRALVAIFSLALLPSLSAADVVAVVNDAICDMRITGKITDEDFLSFVALSTRIIAQDGATFSRDPNALHGVWPRTVCLEGLGGSYLAGIGIALLIQGRFATRVEPDAECYSACAIAFMAGSAAHPEDVLFDWNPETNMPGWKAGPNRTLSSTSRLGFHAPYIDYSGREEIPVDEVASGTRVLLALTAYLLSSTKANFPIELAAAMMSQGPEDTYLIDEVGQLNAWGIQLDTSFHPLLTKQLFRRAWETVAHSYEFGDPGYGAIGDTAYGDKALVSRLASASGWSDNMERVEPPGGAPFLTVTNVGNEASFGAAFIDYGNTFELRVLSPDLQTEYSSYVLKGWQLADPHTKIHDFR